MAKPNGEEFTKDEIGALGETIAARYLWTRGCKVLFRNYRAPKGGEIDIVCREGECCSSSK